MNNKSYPKNISTKFSIIKRTKSFQVRRQIEQPQRHRPYAKAPNRSTCLTLTLKMFHKLKESKVF